MRLLFRLPVACLLAASTTAHADDAVWRLSIDRWGNAEHRTLVLSEGDSPQLSGRLHRDAIHGTRQDGRLAFTAGDPATDGLRFEGHLDGDTLDGRIEFPDTQPGGRRIWHAVHGQRLAAPSAPAGTADAPRRFDPDTFSNVFSADVPPVLVIRPGEVIATSTLDSGGVDHAGHTRALYGNPQTGPFFVWGAQPGDVLAVTVHALRLTRDYADSLAGFAARTMSLGMARRSAGLGTQVRWTLDRDRGTASVADAPAALRGYTVPLRPMLGGLGVAPDFGYAPFSTGDSGDFGGNMDYNGLVAGSTVYLPVQQPGALLYLGDGHALQGDGETTGWALETSLDVEFSVALLPARPLATPRIDADDAIATLGQAGSLDDAERLATAGMVQWLAQDYGLDDRAASLVIGTAAQLRIATLAGRNAGVVMRLPKEQLRRLGTNRNAAAPTAPSRPTRPLLPS